MLGPYGMIVQPRQEPSRVRTRLIKLSVNITKRIINSAREEFEDPSNPPRKSYYYKRIFNYSNECKNKEIEPAGICCFSCSEIIRIGSKCVSAYRSHGRKYIHEECAIRLHIIEPLIVQNKIKDATDIQRRDNDMPLLWQGDRHYLRPGQDIIQPGGNTLPQTLSSQESFSP